MTDEELFYALTTDPTILRYHDSLALIDWRISVCVQKRKITAINGILGKREPRRVYNLRKYLRNEYGITNQLK